MAVEGGSRIVGGSVIPARVDIDVERVWEWRLRCVVAGIAGGITGIGSSDVIVEGVAVGRPG